MDLPQDIRDFLSQNIDSVAQMEALVLFQRDRAESYTADDLARRLYITPAAAEVVLQALHRRGLIAPAPNAPPGATAYSYQPSTDQLHQQAAQMVAFYGKYLIPVTNFIHSKPVPVLTQFADAFRLWEKK